MDFCFSKHKKIQLCLLFYFASPIKAALFVTGSISVFHHRRLSQRPTTEELEQRNILKREYPVLHSKFLV